VVTALTASGGEFQKAFSNGGERWLKIVTYKGAISMRHAQAIDFRLFMPANDKGGLGKSTITSILFGYLLSVLGSGAKVKGIDSDPKNKSFHRKYPEAVDLLNIRELRNADALVNPFEDGTDIVLVDTRASAMSDEDRGIKAWIEEVDLFGVAGEFGIGITFGAIVNHERENIEALKDTFELIGDRADWIIFRNFRDRDPMIWDTSNLKREMLGSGIAEIEIPAIHKHYERQMHVEKVALENVKPQNIADIGRKRNLISVLYSQLEAIEPLLVPHKVLAARARA
jgi:hypothetical protein